MSQGPHHIEDSLYQSLTRDLEPLGLKFIICEMNITKSTLPHVGTIKLSANQKKVSGNANHSDYVV